MRGKVTILVAIPFLAVTGCEVECPPGTISVEKRCLAPDAGDGSVSDGSPGGDAGTGNGTGDAQTPGDASGPPQLTSLEVSAGKLDPPFDPAVHEYRVEVPTWISVLRLRARTSGTASLSLGSLNLDEGTWSDVQMLEDGPTQLEVALEAEPSTSRYELTVERREPAQLELVPTNQEPAPFQSLFGESLGLSRDGSVLAIGAPKDSGQPTDPETLTLADSGAVFVFRRDNDGWAPDGYIKAPNARVGQFFSIRLGLSDDGRTLVATNLAFDEEHHELAYVFRHNGAGWNHEATLEAPPSITDGQPYSVSMASDASRLLVSTYNGTFVFASRGSTWELEANIAQGSSRMSRSGNLIVVKKAGAVELFERRGTTWSPAGELLVPTVTEAFVIALTASGDAFAVGIDGDDSHNGRALTFRRDENGWNMKPVPAPPLAGDAFGTSVMLSNEGDTLFVSSGRSGHLSTFSWTGDEWTSIDLTQLRDGSLHQATYGFASNGTVMLRRVIEDDRVQLLYLP